MAHHRTPFPAIVGQEELKRALLAVAANDVLDGLLIRGEKGTAKSTAVRGLVDLLPEQRAVADCPYGCPPDDRARQCESCRMREELPVETRSVPLVTLPLGATRERVVGTLSVADALEGEAEFDPGLLARANRGILYVDEVNLLEDHLVDVLLDAAESGINRVERDGVSLEHPAEFTLIGTMNPEEGSLRPQLRDRFALQATVTGCRDVDDRIEIIDRALSRDAVPEGFEGDYVDETRAERDRLLGARERLGDVSLPAEFKRGIAELCRDAGVDGHRGDIAIAHTARTLAAIDGRGKVIEPDLREAARLALPHRLQSRPFEDDPDVDDVLEDHFDDEDGDDGGDGSERGDESEGDDGSENGDERENGDGGNGDGSDEVENAGDDPADGEGPSPDVGEASGEDTPTDDPDIESGVDEDGTDGGNETDDEDGTDDRKGAGESDESEEATPIVPGEARAAVGEADSPDAVEPTAETARVRDGTRARVSESTDARGARVRTEPAGEDDAVDAAASVRAAAAEGRTTPTERDLKTAVKSGTAGTLVVFVVDASASMRAAMRDAKGVVLSMLQDAYEHRDRVAFVAVAGEESEVLLPPTDSVTLAARHLKELPTGDRTPLPSGLEAARRLLARSDADAGLVVVVTDGRANVTDGSPTARTREAARGLADAGADTLVVDASEESGNGRGTGRGTGLIDLIETETGGRRISLSELSAERVTDAAESVHRDRNRSQ